LSLPGPQTHVEFKQNFRLILFPVTSCTLSNPPITAPSHSLPPLDTFLEGRKCERRDRTRRNDGRDGHARCINVHHPRSPTSEPHIAHTSSQPLPTEGHFSTQTTCLSPSASTEGDYFAQITRSTLSGIVNAFVTIEYSEQSPTTHHLRSRSASRRERVTQQGEDT
jgi:hypothetical protein